MFIGTGEVYSLNNTQGGISVRLTRGSFGVGDDNFYPIVNVVSVFSDKAKDLYQPKCKTH